MTGAKIQRARSRSEPELHFSETVPVWWARGLWVRYAFLVGFVVTFLTAYDYVGDDSLADILTFKAVVGLASGAALGFAVYVLLLPGAPNTFGRTLRLNRDTGMAHLTGGWEQARKLWPFGGKGVWFNVGDLATVECQRLTEHDPAFADSARSVRNQVIANARAGAIPHVYVVLLTFRNGQQLRVAYQAGGANHASKLQADLWKLMKDVHQDVRHLAVHGERRQAAQAGPVLAAGDRPL